MAASGKLSIGKLVKRYAVVVLLPTLSAGSIYLDWNHTRKWKIAEGQKKLVLTSGLQ